METIAYTVGGTVTEISFTTLGAGMNPRLTLATHGPSRFNLPLPGIAPETAAIIPFEAPCTVYTGRTGSGGSWTGGTILFQGRRVDNSGDVSGARVSSELVIEDAWYDLRFLTLQATWQIVTGGTVSSPIYGTACWPDAVLFQATPGVNYSPAPVNEHITTGQAITEILNYAISGGVNLQVGTISPNLYVPFYPVRSMRCADALKICLRPHPDCTTEIDYTTTPPTFNVRQRSALTALTLPYNGSTTASGATRTHLTSSIKPRPDLIPSRVGIFIKTIGAIGGQQTVAISTDIYPTGAASGLRSFDTSLDMSGPRQSLVTCQVTATAAAFTTLPWWQLKVPAFSQPETVSGSLALLNTAINDGSKDCITVVDENGNPINLTTYPCVLEHEGTVHPWTGVQTIKAMVTGHFTHQRQKNIGTAASPVWVPVKTSNNHVHALRVHLCNAPAGTTTYTLSQVLSPGEVYPAGLAQSLYSALQTLQYQFDHAILEQPFRTVIKPGRHALNVSGGPPGTAAAPGGAWASMNAMVQEVTMDLINSPATGLTSVKTQIRCGPVEHLEPGQLVQLTNLFQNRDFSKINPNERTSGLANGGMNAAMPSGTARENTTQGEPDDAQQMFSAPDATTGTNTNGWLTDPANSQIVFNQYQNSSATPAATGYVTPQYRGAGAPTSGTLAPNVQYRLYCTYLDTTAYALWVCKTAGSNSTSVWTQISGGSGGMNFRGLWVSTTTYNLNDVVVIQTGASQGTYVSLIASNTNDPATGTGWMQIASGNLVGAWT
jgi:hypothetical protein